jgi:hypothetical protein
MSPSRPAVSASRAAAETTVSPGPARRGQPRSDVDAVTVERHVVSQDVGRMDADAQQHAIVGREIRRQVGAASMQRAAHAAASRG